MAEWKPLFEIDEIKRVLQESNDEVNDPKVRENMPKKEAEAKNDSAGDENRSKLVKAKVSKPDYEEPAQVATANSDTNIESEGLFYFSTNEKAYRVFDPDTSEWLTQEEKPSDDQLNTIKQKVKQKEQQTRTKSAQPEQVSEKEGGEQDPAEEKPMTEEELKKREQKKKKRKKQQLKKKAKWFEARLNTFIYASGLPLDIE